MPIGSVARRWSKLRRGWRNACPVADPLIARGSIHRVPSHRVPFHRGPLVAASRRARPRRSCVLGWKTTSDAKVWIPTPLGVWANNWCHPVPNAKSIARQRSELDNATTNAPIQVGEKRGGGTAAVAASAVETPVAEVVPSSGRPGARLCRRGGFLRRRPDEVLQLILARAARRAPRLPLVATSDLNRQRGAT